MTDKEIIRSNFLRELNALLVSYNAALRICEERLDDGEIFICFNEGSEDEFSVNAGYQIEQN